ncbi:MAG: RDD family protein [Chloroflexi bacterium]|nr:RDD family protein [Chloroflexota bacterium]
MSTPENNVYIETPENVTLEAEVAGFGSRTLAALLDYLIMTVAILLSACLFLRSLVESNSSTTALTILLVFTIVTFYHLIFEIAWNGQTPGKRALKLRVVQVNGLPATVGAIVIRNLVRVFDFLPVSYGIGLTVMFATRHNQRLGDLAARTIVVHERHQVELDAIREDFQVRYTFLYPNDPIPEYITTQSLTQQDRRLIVNFLQRRHDLSARESLALSLAKRIAQNMGGTAPGWFSTLSDAERFLEQVAKAFEQTEQR